MDRVEDQGGPHVRGAGMIGRANGLVNAVPGAFQQVEAQVLVGWGKVRGQEKRCRLCCVGLGWGVGWGLGLG